MQRIREKSSLSGMIAFSYEKRKTNPKNKKTTECLFESAAFDRGVRNPQPTNFQVMTSFT